jgi:hypothetical protein
VLSSDRQVEWLKGLTLVFTCSRSNLRTASALLRSGDCHPIRDASRCKLLRYHNVRRISVNFVDPACPASGLILWQLDLPPLDRGERRLHGALPHVTTGSPWTYHRPSARRLDMLRSAKAPLLTVQACASPAQRWPSLACTGGARSQPQGAAQLDERDAVATREVNGAAQEDCP